jgi:hypothetical protein
MSEVGEAIGEVTLQHSTAVHGEAYAEQVTQKYIDAAAYIGLAGYKISNVVTIGVYGVAIEAAIEGTVLALSLYDFLVGPVLLQCRMMFVQAPFTKPKEYFVVLRCARYWLLC